MQTSFAAWQDALLPALPGAVLAVTRSVFLAQARTFYFRTRTWREMLGPLSAKAGQGVIHLNPVDQRADVCFIERAWFNDAPLGVVTVSPAGGNLPSGGPGTPGWVRLLTPHMARLEPVPDADIPRAVRIEVSVQPALGVDALPPFATTHHFAALEAGCLAKMMAQPSKPYSNASMAVFYHGQFLKGIADAIAMNWQGHVQGRVPWAYQNVPLT